MSQKHQLLDLQYDKLTFNSQHLIQNLRDLHKTYNKRLKYPQSHTFKSAIYDVERNYIFGTIKNKKQLDKNLHTRSQTRLHLVSTIKPYYLGAAYLLIESEIDQTPIKKLIQDIILFMLGAGIFFTVLGVWLGKLFVAPMRDSMTKMNHFIQDTTHELNTPISTILTNIEMIETFGGCSHKTIELKRIEIASRTLSRIYDDLTYLNLNHKYHREVVSLDISKFARERVLYFHAMAETKDVALITDIEDGIVLNIDKNDATRLLDNLITNAIKYNLQNGSVTVVINSKELIVSDTGIGIKKTDLVNISQRFKRANKSEGGFGIGLDIVTKVANEYKYKLSIDSKIKDGTKVSIQW